MTCSSKIFKYSLAVLAETPASYILMYCNASQRFSLLFIASSSRKWYWSWTLPWIKAWIELSSTFVYDYKMSTGSSEEFAPRQGGTNNNETHDCEPIFCNFSILRHQVWCTHAIVVQRMHVRARKMPSCYAISDLLLALLNMILDLSKIEQDTMSMNVGVTLSQLLNSAAMKRHRGPQSDPTIARHDPS